MHDNESKALAYKGFPPNHCCCDSTWRRLPNGEQAIFFLTGGNFEPEPGNIVVMLRSKDEGETWSEPETVITNPDGGGVTLSEVVVYEGVITVYLQIHGGHFERWFTSVIRSRDNGKTWSEPQSFDPVPRRSMIRTLYRSSWGEWFLPYQYYAPVNGEMEKTIWGESHENPWNGVLSGPSPEGPWTDSQRIQGAKGWAEVNVVELRDGRLVMLARSDGAGVLLRSESADRGRNWSPYVDSGIANPGSKIRLFRLKDGCILLLHNPSGKTSHPNSKPWASVNRNPLALWISDDDMKTWSVRKTITDFPGMLAYPDGEVDAEEKFVHFAFDYNRHDVIYWKVAIPPA